jgi:protein SCO1/2
MHASDPRSKRRRRWLGAAVAICLAACACGAALALAGGTPKPPLYGDVVDRQMPNVPLENERGGVTSLASYRGRVVVVAPFLTLCGEVCPLTTGAFEAMRRDVVRAHLGARVTFAEVTVDPARDTPARLRAFARMTGVHFPLLTGTPSQIARFWSFLGVAYWRTREGSPPDTDWLTGKPLTYDVEHTDGLFVIDASGHERVLDVGMPSVDGHLSPALSKLLDARGRSELAHPLGGWTIPQALDDLSRVLGRRVPAVA